VQILLLPAIIHRGIVPVYLDFQINFLYPEQIVDFHDVTFYYVVTVPC